MSQSIFTNFTNLYSISKTIRMELVPTPTTKTFLNFDKDEARAENYVEIKKIFDKLHRQFISQSLSSVEIDFEDFLKFYTDFVNIRLNRKTRAKEWESIQKEMDKKLADYRKIIVAKFNQYGEIFKDNCNRELILANPTAYKKPPLGDKGYKVLTEKGIMEVLKHQARSNDNLNELAVIGSFDNFFTYFGSFNQTRENLYKDDGTATAIATRLIDDNLIRFCDNIILWKELNTKYNLHNIPEINPDLFDIREYSKILTQTGIDVYNKESNDLGQSSLAKTKSLINRFLQSENRESKGIKFKDLYKVMLTERESYITEYDENTIMEVITKFDALATATLPTISGLIPDIKNFELDKIWLKSSSISDLSARYCGGQNWDLLATILKNLGYAKNDKGEIKLDKFVQLSVIKEAFGKLALGEVNISKSKVSKTNKSKKSTKPNAESIFDDLDNQEVNQESVSNTNSNVTSNIVYTAKDIFLNFWFETGNLLEGQEDDSNLWEVFVRLLQNDWNKLTKDFGHYQKELTSQVLSQTKYEPAKPTNYTERDKNGITTVLTQANLVKKYADTVLGIWNTIRLFELAHNRKSEYANYDNDASFYDPLQSYLLDFSAFNYYNDLRNFSTKKAFKTDKFKLNFDNSTLLNGWDINKESDNTGIIIRSGNKYELLILNKTIKGNNQLFKKTGNSSSNNPTDNPIFSSTDQGIWKMEYKLLPGVNKMLPKVAFADGNAVLFQRIITEDVLRVRRDETFKKDKLIKQDLNIWIDFFKQVLRIYPDWQVFDFEFKATEDYEDVSQFYREVEKQGYRIKFVPLNPQVLDKYEKDGRIHRFWIKNKDWNEGSTGTKNMQTIYFENLFDADNLANTVYKLNGEAEVFQRQSSLEPKTEERNTNSIITINKRYTEDKMFLHLPININFGSQNITKYNDFLKDNLSNQKPNFLGIDRGENNLLYCVLTDSSGKILMQKSLNILGGQDYEKLLNAKQEERKQAKESWSAIENIKNLKSGYLSLVVYELCKIAFENNALIVLENLNFGFKKSRTAKFEKSVYQKFEVALATKLQHLFFKNVPKNELGGSLNALQLCPPLDITTIDKVSQWGIINYVVASYTSRTCPLTGWHKTIYIKDNPEEIKQKFNLENDSTDNTSPIKIIWHNQQKCFGFEYTSVDLITKKLTTWQVLAHNGLIRNVYDSKTRTSGIITGTEIHNNLNEILGIFDKDNINDQIQDTLSDSQWKKLVFNYNLITNLRVKKTVDGIKQDIIQSPVLCTPNNCVFYGVKQAFEPLFFDTQKAREQAIVLGLDKESIPINGDANGAYHIAKKGLDKWLEK